MRRLILAFLLTGALLACGPEADRERGDGRGSGADPGNRDEEVEMHGSEEPVERIYFDTPVDDTVEDEED